VVRKILAEQKANVTIPWMERNSCQISTGRPLVWSAGQGCTGTIAVTTTRDEDHEPPHWLSRILLSLLCPSKAKSFAWVNTSEFWDFFWEGRLQDGRNTFLLQMCWWFGVILERMIPYFASQAGKVGQFLITLCRVLTVSKCASLFTSGLL
jgi:hypothetical protein